MCPKPKTRVIYIFCKLLMTKVQGSTIVSRRSTHGGGAPYKSVKEGDGHSFECFRILSSKECPCHVESDLMPSKQIIGQTITYNGTTNGFEVKS